MRAKRIAALRARIELPMLVTNPTNVFYLTGFDSTNAALLVGEDDVRLFADSRYAEAGRSVPDVEFVESGRVLLADLASRLSGGVLFEEEHLTYGGYRTLGHNGLQLTPTSGIVEALRAVKDDTEQAQIEEASRIADTALGRLLEEPWLGRSERELAARLQVLIHEAGGEGAAFNVIIGSGPNGAKPHARPSDRRIAVSDFVVVDFGVLLNHYRSDVARTISIGEPPDRLAEIFEITLEAHETALASIRPGMTGKEADTIARSIITDAGYGPNFGHSLGHGIGLDVHEAPMLSPIFDSVLEVGHVVTVEPGIYLPDLGGVRIENLCVIREDGLQSVTDLSKRFVVDT